MTSPELDARAAWNAGADAFVHFVESGADYYRHLVHGPALLAACGDVLAQKALDVGCGDGYFSRLLARAGAAVTGIDLSDRLIERAIEMEAAEPLGISYSRLDAEQLATCFAEETFDLVTGCMSLQDAADSAAVLAGAARVVRRQGRAVFSVPHPCTDPPLREWKRDGQGKKLALCLDRYFDSGPAVCHWNMRRLKYPWRTPFRRHTLTEWSGMISGAGLVIRGLEEPRPDAALVAARPELEDCSRMPYFLVFVLGRA
jgi:2-polyprenyl-3-methyl-5-hydroxy-6-metoxy-1,4-benzoquinol methylase